MFRGPIHAGFALCAAALASSLAISGCAHRATAKIPPPARRSPAAPAPPAKIGSTETGVASWYGNPYHGRRAASGEIYDMHQLTAAHRTLPFQTWVEVTDLDNGKKITVRITDRGPFVDGRIIDLSLAAARAIDMVGPGIARVKLKVVPAPPEDDKAAEVDAEPAEAAQTSPPPAPPPKPRPIPPASPPTRDLYTVQAASFADRDRAEAYAAVLRAQFADFVSESRVVSSPPIWKVLLGRDLTLDAANQLAAQLKDSGATAAVIRDSY